MKGYPDIEHHIPLYLVFFRSVAVTNASNYYSLQSS